MFFSSMALALALATSSLDVTRTSRWSGSLRPAL